MSATMSPTSETYIPAIPAPPVDITTYSRSMHQHTKRLMDAANHTSHRRSNRSTHHGTPSMPNGTSSTSSSMSSSNGTHEYHD